MGSRFHRRCRRPGPEPLRIRVCAGLLAILGFAAGAFAGANSRTALVIGNQRYESTVGPLRNTANDARAVARTLRGLGFAVMERHDLSRDEFLRAVEEFRRTLPGAEVGLFYYAGHGLSISGENYLLPIRSGFAPATADEVTVRMLAETRLFNAEQAVADMSAAGARCNLVILDACRTNRLPGVGRTRAASASGGLAEMTPPAGSLIAFSTDAGRTAFDGDGANGLYTEELLKNLASPGLTIEQVFKRTRAGVLRRSEGGQVPAEYSRLVGEDIYLAGIMRVAAALPVDPPIAAVTPVKTETEIEADVTRSAVAGKTEDCLAGLRRLVRTRGPGDYAARPLGVLLDRVKEDLRNAAAPSPRVIAAVATCRDILAALPEVLPRDGAVGRDLAAKGHNRRGDALLLLGRPQEALAEFEAALPLDPLDAYILYNRGRARLALDQREAARADFAAAMDAKFDQPKARRLAAEALAGMR